MPDHNRGNWFALDLPVFGIILMMIGLLKKYQKELIASFLLLALFLVSRLINLKILPIFVDEAIYLRWAQIAKNDASWRFISLTDGKQPLFVWLTMISMKVIQDPLIAGRIVSVVAGLATMIGLWFLTMILFKNKRTAFFTLVFYLFIPFYLLYDRMALMDSLVGTFSVWALLFEILLIRTLRLDFALILGWILGAGILTKTSGFINIYLFPLVFVLFDWRKRKWRLNLLKLGVLALSAVIISQIFYSILRLSPWSHMVAQKDTTFVYPIKEWLSHPLMFFWGNLRGEFHWLVTYLTWPVALLVGYSLVRFKKHPKEKLLLFSWFIVPMVGLAFLAKVLYPRFILFMSLPLLVLAAASLEELAGRVGQRWRFLLLCALIFVLPLRIDLDLLFKPTEADIPINDRGQYIDSWPAGWGVEETVVFAQREAKDQEIFIATEGTFGLMPSSLE
ncbi:MAG TPA: glycosyltransferase family 39 protein, partial [Candidatus Bathyarchaeia archaeon]|nr:glycosyltransferase family 39 protein [Candidatus Bathyarchaeia archaeon]